MCSHLKIKDIKDINIFKDIKDILCLYEPGDVAGIGWERSECTPPPPGQAPKGRVYFTYGGQRLSPILEDVAGGMWPLVHIQKKVGLFFFFNLSCC